MYARCCRAISAAVRVIAASSTQFSIPCGSAAATPHHRDQVRGRNAMDYPQDLDGLRWEKDAATKAGYVIFDRPPMNVVSFKARSQIAQLIGTMDEDRDIRVI